MGEILATVRTAIATREPFDWRVTREAISAAHAAATSISERVEALQAHQEFMNYVAQYRIGDADRAEFQALRKQEFNLFLVAEARIGDNASVELMDEITQREIAAGRLKPDDELRKITEDALAQSYTTKAELHRLATKKPSFLNRLFAKRGAS